MFLLASTVMNKPEIGPTDGISSIRSPVIINQLGSELDSALVDHWSRPRIVDHPDGSAPWNIPNQVDVLLTRPSAGWDKAPAAKPAEWPFGLRWIQQPRPASTSFRPGCSTARWSPSVAVSRPIRSRNFVVLSGVNCVFQPDRR
jgi:hypothetical protein